MRQWKKSELLNAGYEIENSRITMAMVCMKDHGILETRISIGGEASCMMGGYVIGKGFLGAKDDFFRGYASGTESIMRIMDTVGVDDWRDLEGKYIRVAHKGLGSTVHIFGNIIQDKWFDFRQFFHDKQAEVAELRNELLSSAALNRCMEDELRERILDSPHIKEIVEGICEPGAQPKWSQEQVLAFIQKWRPASELLTHGMCYWFASILCARFDGVLYYAPVNNHFLAKIGERFYDAYGLRYGLDETPMPWSQFAETEAAQARRIARDCILKLDDDD